eukprot:14649055-Ditylum_brightwellii.AAC.1
MVIKQIFWKLVPARAAPYFVVHDSMWCRFGAHDKLGWITLTDSTSEPTKENELTKMSCGGSFVGSPVMVPLLVCLFSGIDLTGPILHQKNLLLPNNYVN